MFVTIVTNPYVSAKNKDNDTKLSGYGPWGLLSTYITSWMTLSPKSPVRNPQHPPNPSPPRPPITDTLLIKILAQNLQGIFPRVQKHHPLGLGGPSPLRFLNVLQVPPFLTPHS